MKNRAMASDTVASVAQMPIAALAPEPSFSDFGIIALGDVGLVVDAPDATVVLAVSDGRADGVVVTEADGADTDVLLVIDVEGLTFNGIKSGTEPAQVIWGGPGSYISSYPILYRGQTRSPKQGSSGRLTLGIG